MRAGRSGGRRRAPTTRCGRRSPPPPPPSRTKWTRRVPHPVLIGHAACRRSKSAGAPWRTTTRPSRRCGPRARCLPRPALPSPPPRTKWTRRVPHLVLIGHAAPRAPRPAPVPSALSDPPGALSRGAARAMSPPPPYTFPPTAPPPSLLLPLPVSLLYARCSEPRRGARRPHASGARRARPLPRSGAARVAAAARRRAGPLCARLRAPASLSLFVRTYTPPRGTRLQAARVSARAPLPPRPARLRGIARRLHARAAAVKAPRAPRRLYAQRPHAASTKASRGLDKGGERVGERHLVHRAVELARDVPARPPPPPPRDGARPRGAARPPALSAV